MSEVTKRYFIAEGERAERVLTDGLALANRAHHRLGEYLKKVGVDGFWGRRNSAPFAVVVYGEEAGRLPGFLAPEREVEGGKKFWVYRPDGRTTIGKRVLFDLREMASFNFSEFACTEFGVVHSVIGSHAASRSGMAMYSSAAGYVQKKLVFVIPFGGDQSDRDPVIPPDLREIKKSEYIALTEEGES